MHSKGMRFHLPNLLTSLQVPELDHVFSPTGNGSFSIGRKGHRIHLILVTVEMLQLFACYVVPQANRAIEPPRQALLAIGGKSDRNYASGVSLEALDFLARLDVQQPQRLVIERAEQHLLAV